MINFVQPANVVYLVAPRDLKSGDGVVIGTIFAIATIDAKSGKTFPGMVEGGVELRGAAAFAPAGGTAIHFDETTQLASAAGGKLVGYKIEPPPDHTLAAGFVWVKLTPAAA